MLPLILFRYLCELAGSNPFNLLSEEQALLTMVSSQQAVDLKDLLTTNRGSRVKRSNLDLNEVEEVALKCGRQFPTCPMSRLDILRLKHVSSSLIKHASSSRIKHVLSSFIKHISSSLYKHV